MRKFHQLRGSHDNYAAEVWDGDGQVDVSEAEATALQHLKVTWHSRRRCPMVSDGRGCLKSVAVSSGMDRCARCPGRTASGRHASIHGDDRKLHGSAGTRTTRLQGGCSRTLRTRSSDRVPAVTRPISQFSNSSMLCSRCATDQFESDARSLPGPPLS